MVAREKRLRASLKKYHDAIGMEHDYAVKLVQLDPKRRRELVEQGRQPVVSLDLYDIVRYSKAILSGSQIYFDVAPYGPGKTDAETKDLQDAAAIAKDAMMEQIRDVDIGYPKVRRRVVYMGQAARAGAARLDVVNSGPYGTEVVPVQVDPRNLAWDGEQWLSFNDHGCPELWETIRPLLSWAKNNPDFDRASREMLVADDGENIIPRSANPSLDPTNDEHDDESARITLKVGWIKADPDEVPTDNGSTPIDPSQWHMACDTCGYSEADLVGTAGYDGASLPELMPCPQCGVTPEGEPVSMMHRIDTEAEIGRVATYSEAHRRVVIAPFCPQAGFLRDASWPKGLTNFPYMLHVPDPFPLEPFGNSATSLNIDLQSLKNKHLRLMDEQMERNRDLTVAVENSFWDAKHQPHRFDGSQGYTAFVNGTERLGDIKHFQGSGLNPASGIWMDRLDAELGRHRGVGQVAADAQQMKGMPVGTVARIQETGDVPLDEMIRILREDEQPFMQRWLELFCAYATVNRWVDTAGPDGERVFRIFNGSSMPPLKLRVIASPNMNAVDMDKIEKMKGLVGAPPSLVRFALKDANVPNEVINELIHGMAPPAGGVVPNGLPIAPPQPAMIGAGR